MKMDLPGEFEQLMDGMVVTGKEVAEQLNGYIQSCQCGDYGTVSATALLQMERIHFAVIVATFGADSDEVRKQLSSLALTMYNASTQEGANYWRQIVFCYENCGEELMDFEQQHLDEARRRLAE